MTDTTRTNPIDEPEIRHDLTKLALYKAGRQVLPHIKNPFRLASNESAIGASKLARQAFVKAGKSLSLYPDESAFLLRRSLATHYGLDEDRIVCGNGSDDLLHCIAFAYLGKDDEAIITQYGFGMYKLVIQAMGAKPVIVPEKNFLPDVDAILTHVSDKTRMVFLANPSNPTGSFIKGRDIRRLHQHLPRHILLLLDGAYLEYVREKDCEDGFSLAQNHPNCVTLRTFSKAYGLASLRLGWSYSSHKIAQSLHYFRMPFNVSRPAQMAGIAALKDQKHLMRAKEHNVKWLSFLEEKITQAGFRVLPSQANFLLVHFDKSKHISAKLADEVLCRKGILVRCCDGYGLEDYLRISVGTPKPIDKLFQPYQNWHIKDNSHMLYARCQMSYARCHMPDARCQMSDVICQMSNHK